jgi:hypothetical protein
VGGQTQALSTPISLAFRLNLGVNAVLGTLYINPHAILVGGNDPVVRNNADALDIGAFAN